MSKNKLDTNFYNRVTELLEEALKSVVQTVNKTMVYTYFEIGRMIVEEEQNGKERAEYGKQILKELPNHLITKFEKGFSVTNLQQMKNFYNVYGKQQTVSAKSENSIVQNENLQLSWSHYLLLMRIENIDERKFYELETIDNNWSFASKYQTVLPSKQELKN